MSDRTNLPRRRVVEAAASIASFAGLILAAIRGDTAWAVVTAALYLALVILYATRVVSQTIIATGIAASPRYAGDVYGRVRDAMDKART